MRRNTNDERLEQSGNHNPAPAGAKPDRGVSLRRCRHCGQLLLGDGADGESIGAESNSVCPHCGMRTDEEHLT